MISVNGHLRPAESYDIRTRLYEYSIYYIIIRVIHKLIDLVDKKHCHSITSENDGMALPCLVLIVGSGAVITRVRINVNIKKDIYCI